MRLWALLIGLALTLALVGCMLNHNQRAELDLDRFRHQDQLLPPSFLAKIVRVHPRPEGTRGIGYLYTVFDVQPIDEEKNPIPALELKAVQAAITPFTVIPDDLYGPPRRTSEDATGLTVNAAGVHMHTAPGGSTSNGGTHGHGVTDPTHSHQVFTESDLDAWRANFLAGRDDVENYLAIVNSVSAGQDIYYFVVGFALDRDVLPAGQALPVLEYAPPDLPGEYESRSHQAIVTEGQDFTFDSPSLLNLTEGFGSAIKASLELQEGLAFTLSVRDDNNERQYFGVVRFGANSNTAISPQTGDFINLTPVAGSQGREYTFLAVRAVRR